MEWFERLPRSIAFVDVETTGLSSEDRVVSIGAFWIASRSLCDPIFPVSFAHMIFNPGRPSHPRAAQVHGYSDWLLSHQDRFETYAGDVREFLCDAELIVAHNAEFDLGFINAELVRANKPAINRSSFCTMSACQNRGMHASLEAVCKNLGLKRAGKSHGALEDAWLAMMVYLWLQGCTTRSPFSEAGHLLEPFNLRTAPQAADPHAVAAPPRRAGIDPRASNTGRSIAATPAEAARIDALVEQIKELKRAGSLNQAEILLLAEVGRQEAQAKATGSGVAPWYYDQLAVVYSKQHRLEDEIRILERYERQPKAPGAMPAQLLARLEKARLHLSGARA